MVTHNLQTMSVHVRM